MLAVKLPEPAELALLSIVFAHLTWLGFGRGYWLWSYSRAGNCWFLRARAHITLGAHFEGVFGGVVKIDEHFR